MGRIIACLNRSCISLVIFWIQDENTVTIVQVGIRKHDSSLFMKRGDMRILISADMEGISGVVHWDQVTPGHSEYARFRQIMTEEVNAAVAGAFDGGANEVVVTDGHWDGRNILVEEIDKRARLHSGTNSPFSMVQGVENGGDGLIFVGYHARAGSSPAVLAHTWSANRVAGVWLNDTLVGEFGLNAALAGHFKIPVIMVTGDQTACAQTVDLLGAMETVVVKQATGFESAECLPPSIAQKQIQLCAARAVKAIVKKRRKAYTVSAPVRVTIEFLQPAYADRAVRLPGTKRKDARTVEIGAEDMIAALAGFRAAVRISTD
jgi:D-amino peptidase